MLKTKIKNLYQNNAEKKGDEWKMNKFNCLGKKGEFAKNISEKEALIFFKKNGGIVTDKNNSSIIYTELKSKEKQALFLKILEKKIDFLKFYSTLYRLSCIMHSQYTSFEIYKDEYQKNHIEFFKESNTFRIYQEGDNMMDSKCLEINSFRVYGYFSSGEEFDEESPEKFLEILEAYFLFEHCEYQEEEFLY